MTALPEPEEWEYGTGGLSDREVDEQNDFAREDHEHRVPRYHRAAADIKARFAEDWLARATAIGEEAARDEIEDVEEYRAMIAEENSERFHDLNEALLELWRRYLRREDDEDDDDDDYY